MKSLMPYLKGLLFIAIAVFTYLSFTAPPAKHFRDDELFRIVFFHVPCDIATMIFLIFGAYLSVRYLVSPGIRWSARAYACNDVAFVFALLAMLTGMVFSKAEWGAWWQWDPRQYSFLIVLLIYGAYFALRISFTSEERARLISSAYACAAIIPAFFLMYVFPRIPGIANDSFHPTNTILQGELDPIYNAILWPLVFLLIALGVWIYLLATRAYLLEAAVQEHYGQHEDHDAHPTVTGVVRPISISNDSR